MLSWVKENKRLSLEKKATSLEVGQVSVSARKKAEHLVKSFEKAGKFEEGNQGQK